MARSILVPVSASPTYLSKSFNFYMFFLMLSIIDLINKFTLEFFI